MACIAPGAPLNHSVGLTPFTPNRHRIQRHTPPVTIDHAAAPSKRKARHDEFDGILKNSLMDSTPPQNWYQDGLRFECTQCGGCCTGTPGFVWINDAELREIANFLGISTGELRLLHTRIARGQLSLTEFANGDCTFFDGATRGCKIYPVRPTQCRTWPFWRSNVESPEAWQRTSQGCPGIGRGQLVTLEEIETRASAREM